MSADQAAQSAPINDQAPDDERMRALLENISTYMQMYHGGSVEMVSFEDNVLTVRLGGACVGCEISQLTLNGWITGTVKPFFPNLKEVLAVD